MTPFNITPHDTDLLPFPITHISFVTPGTLTILTTKDSKVTIASGLAPGEIHPIDAKQVFATGTTMTGLTGYYD